MPKTLGYMLTWTTYGTWLQGDARGYVKNGKIFPGDKLLQASNVSRLCDSPINLSAAQRLAVRAAILTEADKLGQKILALSVASNHIHLVAGYIPKPIGRVVSHYKNAARFALRITGGTDRWWSKGYDKRYCFDKCSLQSRIAYVISHSKNPRNKSGG